MSERAVHAAVVEVKAPAKINLFLSVTGKRADGYHELDSLFYPLPTLSDTIRFSGSESESGAGVRILCNAPGVPCTGANLCAKAYHAYWERAGMPPPPQEWTIEIEKVIPVAGGMGGGSSDAAAVLLFLQNRFQALTEEQLKKTALKLGADVPFFLDPRPSIASGIGERLTPLKTSVESAHPPLLIAAPDFPISAAWAYRALDLSGRKKTPDSRSSSLDAAEAMANANWKALARVMRNDLEGPLYEKFPVLGLLRGELEKSGALKVMVTGSGPTLFGLFRSGKEAEHAMASLSETLDPSIRLILP